jgi:hypothetical protein
MFELFQTIYTKVPLPALGLGVGAKGVIVDEYREPYHAYEIEFVDAQGNTIGLLSLRPNEIARSAPSLLVA